MGVVSLSGTAPTSRPLCTAERRGPGPGNLESSSILGRKSEQCSLSRKKLTGRCSWGIWRPESGKKFFMNCSSRYRWPGRGGGGAGRMESEVSAEGRGAPASPRWGAGALRGFCISWDHLYPGGSMKCQELPDPPLYPLQHPAGRKSLARLPKLHPRVRASLPLPGWCLHPRLIK